MASSPQPYAGSAVILGQGSLASRLLGFLRDMAIAALLGSGWLADALLVSFRLPNLARTLLAEGAFAYTLVPAFRSLNNAGPGRAWTCVRSMTLALFVFFGICALLGALFPDHVALVLAPGFHGMPEVLAMASAFMVLCLLSLPLVSGAAVNSAALMAAGCFRPPAYASAVFNATVILSAGAACVLFGSGTVGAAYALCAGAIAAGMIQWGYQTCYLRRLGYAFPGPVAFRDPVFLRSLRSLPGSAFAVSGHQINLVIAAFLASFLAEGAISALYFAERIAFLALGLIAAPLGLALLSDLAGLAPSLKRETKESAAGKALFTERIATAGRITLFFSLPAAVGAACLALALTSAFFGYGEFGEDALARTAQALTAYLVGLPALALNRPLLAGLGALGDTGAPARAAVAGGLATICLGGLGLCLDAAWALALAVSLAAWLNTALLVRALVRRGFPPLPDPVWLLKVLAACCVMALCVMWTAGLFSSGIGKIAAVPLGMAVYFAATFGLRLDEMPRTWRAVTGRIHSRRKDP